LLLRLALQYAIHHNQDSWTPFHSFPHYKLVASYILLKNVDLEWEWEMALILLIGMSTWTILNL
jgi:hypothetical protein